MGQIKSIIWSIITSYNCAVIWHIKTTVKNTIIKTHISYSDRATILILIHLIKTNVHMSPLKLDKLRGTNFKP